ncbi:MAG TPA: STAS domain-containing protein [Vicinamibacterales bacterium]|nr:STAS domain-containing protein [Vicinamibacterales bacterium]
MEVSQTHLDKVSVLELTGALDCGKADRELRSIFDTLAEQGRGRVILNVGAVYHIDSTCLGLLIAAHVTFQRLGGALHLLNTPPSIQRLLTIAKLDQILLTFATQDEAIRAFDAGTGG